MLIIRFLRCNRADFLLYAGAPLAVFLLGLLVNAGAVLLFRAESTFVFLPLFLAMVCALLGLSAAATSVLQAFPMALSFSVTRRSALLGVVSYTLLAALVLAGLSLLVSWADRAMIYGLFPLLRPGLEVLGDPLYDAGPLPIVAAALGGALAGFVGGAAIQLRPQGRLGPVGHLHGRLSPAGRSASLRNGGRLAAVDRGDPPAGGPLRLEPAACGCPQLNAFHNRPVKRTPQLYSQGCGAISCSSQYGTSGRFVRPKI